MITSETGSASSSLKLSILATSTQTEVHVVHNIKSRTERMGKVANSKPSFAANYSLLEGSRYCSLCAL